MMRVVLSLGGTDLGRSGISTYVQGVLPGLAQRLNARGDSLVVVGTRDELDATPTATAIEHITLPRWMNHAGLSAGAHLVAAGLLGRAARADVLLLPAGNRRITLDGTRPVVAVVHDLAQLRVKAKYDALRMQYVRHAVLAGLQRARVLVAVSECTREEIRRALPSLRVPVRVVRNGVDAERFDARQQTEATIEAARSRYQLRRPYLLYPSRLEHPGKNHERLLQALRLCAAARQHELVLVGADWGAWSRIEATARGLGVGDRVRWLGRVDDSMLPTLVAAADVVLALGLFEGFGLPALEALAAGRPVVASNTGALPEVVGGSGVLCDPYDPQAIAAALDVALRNEDYRARVHLEGPRQAAAQSWDRTAEGVLAACDGAFAA